MIYQRYRLDRLSLFGQPYHGLYKSGHITLPNGNFIAAPSPNNGAVILLRVPGQPEVIRSAAEAEADREAGREWRNYGLISGGRYGASNIVGADVGGWGYVLLIDDSKVRWLMRISCRSSMSDHMDVSLLRFGHFDGTSANWSPWISIQMPTQFVAAVGNLAPLAVAGQNTTGRDFVVAAISRGSRNIADALCRVTITGSVDLSVNGYGMTFSTDLLEWPGRQNCNTVTTTSETGDVVYESSATIRLWQSSPAVDTGQTGTLIYRRVNGQVVRQDLIPAAPYGYEWRQDPDSGDYTTSSNRVYSHRVQVTASRIGWAAYVDDRLVTYTWTARSDRQEDMAAEWHPDLVVFGGLGGFEYAGQASSSGGIDTAADGSVVCSFSWSDAHPIKGAGAEASPSGESTSTTASVMSFSEMLSMASKETSSDIGLTQVVDYAYPFVRSGDIWCYPLLYSSTRTTYSGAAVHDAGRLISPLGQVVPTNMSFDEVFATWHPVTHELVIDSELVCWF